MGNPQKVKSSLDKHFELVHIPIVEQPDALYSVKALVCDSSSEAIESLLTWQKDAPNEADKIRQKLGMLATRDKNDLCKLKYISRDKDGRGVFEVANRGGGSARMLFCYMDFGEEVIVCLLGFWKSKGKKEQAKAFDRAAEMKGEFEKWLREYPEKKNDLLSN